MKRFAMVAGGFLMAGGAWAGPGADIGGGDPSLFPGPLSTSQKLEMQRIGQNVLTARSGVVSDSGAESLRQEMKTLKDELDKAVVSISATPPKLDSTGGRKVVATATTGQITNGAEQRTVRLVKNASGEFVREAAQPANPQPSRPNDGYVPHAAKEPVQGNANYGSVRSRSDLLRQKAQSLSASLKPEDEGGLRAHAISKALVLQDEVRRVLDNPASADGEQVAKLRERLRPKNIAEIQAERRSAALQAGEILPEPSPTISVRTQHR